MITDLLLAIAGAAIVWRSLRGGKDDRRARKDRKEKAEREGRKRL